MGDLPIPESGTAGLVIGALVLVMAGLYALVRRTHRRAEEQYWDQRRRLDARNLPEPADPRRLPGEDPGPEEIPSDR